MAFDKIDHSMWKGVKIILPDIDDTRIEELIKRGIEEGITLVICGKEEELARYESYRDHDHIQFELVPDGVTNMKHAAGLLNSENSEFGGLLAGNISSTAEVVGALIKNVERLPGVERISSYFLMQSPEHGNIIFSDGWLEPNPNALQLAEIAHLSAENAKAHRIGNVKIAFLRAGYDAQKVIDASEIYWEKYADDSVECISEVTVKQAIEAGANVLIFPNLDAGNTSYKIAERLSEFRFDEAVEDNERAIVYMRGVSSLGEEFTFSAPLEHEKPNKEIIRKSLENVLHDDMNSPVALLSFSTIESGYGKGTKDLLDPGMQVLTELSEDGKNVIPHLVQFDAGFIPAIARKKGINIDSPVKHFHFQSRQSFDICMWVAECMQKSTALGPFIQGLAKEGHDTSRGIDVDTMAQMLHIIKEKCILEK